MERRNRYVRGASISSRSKMAEMMIGRVIGILALGGCAAVVCAQTTAVKDCGPGQESTAAAPCKAVSAAERFPFPGAASGSTSATPATPAVDAPAPTVNGPAPSAAEKFPFPGDAPASGATVPSKQFPFPGDAESSSSSSSAAGADSSSSSSQNGDTTFPDDKPETPKLDDKGSSGGKRAKPVKVQTPDERVDEDIQVAGFYRNDGNYQGAYLRAKDAFAVMPDDPEVNLLYAEVALKLGKKDEALEHYQAYVKLDPKGKKVPDAKDEIAKLSASGVGSTSKK